ncbi:DUF6248 family natural product biosynthesis protein (plasmid) [Streptomyces sp. NBC_00637]
MTTSQRPRRPQRKLTAAEHDVVAGVQTLHLHRMLHLGLIDPVPNPSPMSEEEGAWVREHVWPSYLHRIDDGYAWGFWRWSLCERGTCWNCLAGRCDGCLHRQKGRPDACDNAETVHNHLGRNVATLIPAPRRRTLRVVVPLPLPEGRHPARPPRTRPHEAIPQPVLGRPHEAIPQPVP